MASTPTTTAAAAAVAGQLEVAPVEAVLVPLTKTALAQHADTQMEDLANGDSSDSSDSDTTDTDTSTEASLSSVDTDSDFERELNIIKKMEEKETSSGPLRTKNEVGIAGAGEAPAPVHLDSTAVLEPLGVIMNVTKDVVIVLVRVVIAHFTLIYNKRFQSDLHTPAIAEGSVLALANGSALGVVEETFGPVVRPM